ncbi:hypothetical protein F4821DRAFT_271847 [Hypoxylon rubiginosum]|uniref:Uncharacterized protein n=1 Tax=Hypoxylon rubiginosum TaxID=110542 RepID=A0ACC0CS26_9PEZI|nr:hypothetical protein F4821DRAFT_271847 [Hypoxylon rubiginosum]
MAEELRNQNIACNNIINDFVDEESKAHTDLRILFHTIHRKTLRSLVLGQLPHDLHDRYSSNWNNVYDKEGPGTYLIGISIEDRQGAFLNWKEIKKVTGHLEEYRAGCEAWTQGQLGESYGQSQITSAQKSAIQKACLIDNEMELDDDKKWEPGSRLVAPKCMGGKGGVSNINHLIEMLGRRVNESFDEDTYQISSPVYTGCGRRMPKRLLGHDPDYSNLKSSSHVLRLLQSCIRYMGLKPLIHSIPIIEVWEQRLIGLSEVLVTVLAQSLITIDGLNVIKPGTVPGAGDTNVDFYKEAKKAVWVMRPWFRENLQESLSYLQGRDILQGCFETMKAQYKSVGELRKSIDDTKVEQGKIEELKTNFSEAEEDVDKRLQDAREHLGQLNSFLDKSSGMFPDLSEDEEGDSE